MRTIGPLTLTEYNMTLVDGGEFAELYVYQARAKQPRGERGDVVLLQVDAGETNRYVIKRTMGSGAAWWGAYVQFEETT